MDRGRRSSARGPRGIECPHGQGDEGAEAEAPARDARVRRRGGRADLYEVPNQPQPVRFTCKAIICGKCLDKVGLGDFQKFNETLFGINL